MILYPEESTIDFSKMEYIPECKDDFPVVCYGYDLHSRMEPWHWHDEFEANIIESGTAVLKLEGEEYHLKAGDGYLINSETLHSLSSLDNSHCKIKSMIFRKDVIGGKPGSLFWTKYVSPVTERRDFYGWVLKKDLTWQKEILDSLKKIFSLFESEEDDFEIKTRELLSKILSVTVKNLPPENPENKKTTQNNISKIKVMLLYIWQNYSKAITLSDIANAGAASKNDCMLCFAETVGTSPIQYLKNYRLEKAAEYLTFSEKKVSEIAELCGFQDKSYFSKSFFQKFGQKPLDYRKAQRNN
ncbi:MAG: AraC family transcriptional regulator [Oscillospiraceae bacterium]|nr:AraC family transcriptional regulator [Oscillospiraceae bacterium]